MPRYDYQCTVCGNQFELKQSFSEAGSGTCPDCSGAGRRVFHAVPVIYKGSGFYTTDYARPKPPADKEESKTSTASTNTSDDKSSSASETKGESATSSSASESKGASAASSSASDTSASSS